MENLSNIGNVRVLAISGLLFDALLPDPTLHPTLMTLKTEIMYEWTDETERWDSGRLAIAIPLDKIPRVSVLHLKGFIQPVFMRGGTERSALQKLRFHKRECLDLVNLESLIASLKEEDVWDGLQVLEVVDDEGILSPEEVAGLDGAEKIRVKRRGAG